MPPTFPNTEVKELTTWANYTGTLTRGPIPLFCTPKSTDISNAPNGVMRMEGEAIQAILAHCFSQSPPEPIRTMGTRFSFSRVIEPKHVVLDSPYMNKCFVVDPKWMTDDYKARRGEVRPVIVEGGCTINALNRWLANQQLALRTSGAGDGHRIAGCIATGTHGSALGVGAVHDTVLGMHVVVAPDKALFVQSGSAPAFVPDLADWFSRHTGIPTLHVAGDDAFNAMRVALGSMGIVFNVIIESVPLYRLQRKVVPVASNDAALMNAIESLDSSVLHPDINEVPYHWDVLFHPYPSAGEVGAYASLMWKSAYLGGPPALPNPVPPDVSSDTMGMIGRVVQHFGGIIPPLTKAIVRGIISDQLRDRSTGDATFVIPPMVFGPTSLPPGMGASTEIVVNHQDIRATLNTLFRVFEEQASDGNFLLGAMAVRFIPQTSAFLGMNVHPMNCFIELPSVRNQGVLDVYEACWDALESANIPFTCHWGQLHGMNASRLRTYFGSRVDEWRNTRSMLLDATAQKVFAAPILDEVGL